MAIQTINTSDVGTDFIDKLNDNFAECVTGGSSDGSVTVKIPMQGGDLKTATGQVDGKWCSSFTRQQVNGSWRVVGVWGDDNYYKYLHTPLYLSLKNNKVKSVTVPTGSTLSIFCYDEDLSLISNGVVNDVDNIPDGTAYVKFQLYNASGYSQVQLLEVTLAAQPEWVKNVATPLVPQWFNYDCKPPKMWDDANYTTPHAMPTGLTVDANNTRYHDNGCIILPSTYDPQGEPTKLVFWFNGDNCPWFIQHDPYVNTDGNPVVYEKNYKYLLNHGYAVAMCAGHTSMWSGEESSVNSGFWCSRLTPAYIASVNAFYERLMANYNLDPAVYLGAKSAGGGMLVYVATALPFPVRAAAGMSIGICQFDVMRYNYVGTQKTIHKRLGCANWNSFTLSAESGASATLVTNASGASSTQIAEANKLLANKDIYKKTEPFTINSDIDFSLFVDEVLLNTNPFNEGADYPSGLTDLIFASSKVFLTPLKLWCATKDPATPYTWHKIFADWINKNGGTAELRAYTGDDGGHGTFCGGTTHVANNLPTPYGGTMSGVNIGVVEAVEWFKRW